MRALIFTTFGEYHGKVPGAPGIRENQLSFKCNWNPLLWVTFLLRFSIFLRFCLYLSIEAEFDMGFVSSNESTFLSFVFCICIGLYFLHVGLFSVRICICIFCICIGLYFLHHSFVLSVRWDLWEPVPDRDTHRTPGISVSATIVLSWSTLQSIVGFCFSRFLGVCRLKNSLLVDISVGNVYFLRMNTALLLSWQLGCF